MNTLHDDIRDARERLHGSLLDQAMRRELHNARWILVHCECAVQTQEALLAGSEYRLWCSERGVPYRAVERYRRLLSYSIYSRGLCGVRK